MSISDCSRLGTLLGAFDRGLFHSFRSSFPGKQYQLGCAKAQTEDQKQGRGAAGQKCHWAGLAVHGSGQPALFLSVGAFAQTKKGCVRQAGWLPAVRNLCALGPPSAALAGLPLPPPAWGQQNMGIQIQEKGLQ